MLSENPGKSPSYDKDSTVNNGGDGSWLVVGDKETGLASAQQLHYTQMALTELTKMDAVHTVSYLRAPAQPGEASWSSSLDISLEEPCLRALSTGRKVAKGGFTANTN